MEYGECKDKLPETYADMYFALYQHDKILTLRFPAELRKEDIDVPVDRVTAREIITNYRRTAMSFIDFCNSVGDY